MLLSERFLSWAVAKYFRSLGYRVSIRRIRLDHSEIDGEANKNGEKIAIEIKSTRDDVIRGIGQMAIALSHGYSKAVLVTPKRNSKRVDYKVLHHFNFELLTVDGYGNVHSLI